MPAPNSQALVHEAHARKLRPLAPQRAREMIAEALVVDWEIWYWRSKEEKDLTPYQLQREALRKAEESGFKSYLCLLQLLDKAAAAKRRGEPWENVRRQIIELVPVLDAEASERLRAEAAGGS